LYTLRLCGRIIWWGGDVAQTKIMKGDCGVALCSLWFKSLVGWMGKALDLSYKESIYVNYEDGDK
jgi:hypothetical protein